MPFAQLVIGPPGSGKSTYCDGMQQFMNAIDRKCSVINLDPANDKTNYPCALDIRDLVSLEEVMDQEELGPNGGVLFAFEELERNWSWLEDGLKSLKDDYIIIDCPGQVELFTHHTSLPNIFHRIEKLGYRLIVVQLLDSHTITRPTLYISSLLLALRSMLQFPYPLVNVLSKIDNLHNGEPLPFDLDYYTEVQDLDYLLPHLEAEQAGISLSDPDVDSTALLEKYRKQHTNSATTGKWTKLNEALIQLVSDFGLVGFQPLAVEDKASMTSMLRAVDRASGYLFTGSKGDDQLTNEAGIWGTMMQEDWGQMGVKDVQERWIDRREEFDELERKAWEEEAKIAGANADVQGVLSNGVRDGATPTVTEVEAAKKQNKPDMTSKVAALDDEDLEAMQEAFMKQRNG